MNTETETPSLRQPPHNLDAEASVLGSIILDPKQLDEIRPLLRGNCFYLADHQIFYDALLSLVDGGRAMDSITVANELRRRGLYEEIGGRQTMERILESVPSPSHGLHYAKIVAETFKLRELIRVSERTIESCYRPSREDQANEIADKLQTVAAQIREVGHDDSIRTLEEIIQEVFEQKMKREVTRVPTGIRDLDAIFMGIPIGGYTIVAARAGMGKSQLSKQLARNIAGAGTPCGIVSIEESRLKIGSNYLAGASTIDNSTIVGCNWCREHFEELTLAGAKLSPLPIMVDDAQQKLSSIEASIRRMNKRGCKVVIIDHLHLIDGEVDANREQELTEISNRLKKLFKELKIAGIVVCQVNRAGEYESVPELCNLRGTGSLEQDGDVILMLHRSDYYRWKREGEDFTPDHKLDVYVNKNKDGNVGQCTLYFDGDSQTVRDWDLEPAEANIPTFE